MADVKCILCGNDKEFRIQGVLMQPVDNLLYGDGSIDELELPETNTEPTPNYTTIICPECDAEVELGIGEEEAERAR